MTRGDVFTLPEDEYGTYDFYESSSLSPDLQPKPEGTLESTAVLNPEEEAPTSDPSTLGPEVETSEPEGVNPIPETPDQGLSDFSTEEELCSGKPFDAFTDLKNGSLFAFRGESRGRSWGRGSASGACSLSHSLSYSRTVLL